MIWNGEINIGFDNHSCLFISIEFLKSTFPHYLLNFQLVLTTHLSFSPDLIRLTKEA